MDRDGTARGGEDPDIERQVAEFRDLLASADEAQLAALTAELGALRTGPASSEADEPRLSRRRPPPSDVATYVLRVELDEVEPPVWRRLEVAGDLRLNRLHDVVQAAMGWTDSHLHEFASGDAWQDPHLERYLTAFDISEGDEGVAEVDVRLDEVLADAGDRLLYVYDFGDGWSHSITLEQVLPRHDDAPAARCTDGSRACPPENCGGPAGYDELLGIVAAARDGKALSEDDRERLDWYSPAGPAATLAAAEVFDVAAADDVVRLAGEGERSSGARHGGGWGAPQPGADAWPAPVARLVHRAVGPRAGTLIDLIHGSGLDRPVLVEVEVAARMVGPFAWMVRHVGASGVPLTAAGYLRPADVEAVAGALDLSREWIGTLNRERHTAPVLVFRQACQAAGLLRLAKGRVSATRRALALVDDPVGLWWYLAGRLPLGRRQVDRDAGMVVLLDAASGGTGHGQAVGGVGAGDEPIAGAMHALGWAFKDGAVIPGWQVRRLAETTVAVLDRLGVYEEPELGRRIREVTPQGATFARAALLTWPE